MELAPAYVILEHVWKVFLEVQRDTLAHDAHAIDGVRQSLCLGFKNVSNDNLNHFGSY
jgi:hypothetical protein